MSTTNNINATTIMNEIDGLVRQRGVPIQFEHGWGLIKRVCECGLLSIFVLVMTMISIASMFCCSHVLHHVPN